MVLENLFSSTSYSAEADLKVDETEFIFSMRSSVTFFSFISDYDVCIFSAVSDYTVISLICCSEISEVDFYLYGKRNPCSSSFSGF